MAGNSRAESVRRVVELTGLGIAATYFLDPDRGAERRRAAWTWVAGGRRDREIAGPPPLAVGATALTTTPAEPIELEPEPVDQEPPAPPDAPEELVLLSSDVLPERAAGRDAYWPRWGWALVVTITICALAAFAAVGLGIWAIKHRTSTTTRTVTTPAAGIAPVLADPTARRVVGTATQGSVLLRFDRDGAVLAVDGLPAPPPQRRYRVWITSGGTTRTAGDFAARSALLALKPLASGSRVTITRERAAATTDAPGGPRVAALTVP